MSISKEKICHDLAIASAIEEFKGLSKPDSISMATFYQAVLSHYKSLYRIYYENFDLATKVTLD